jgi:hypothetical protein
MEDIFLDQLANGGTAFVGGVNLDEGIFPKITFI